MATIKTDEKQRVKSDKKNEVQRSEKTQKGKVTFSLIDKLHNKYKDRNTGFAFFLKFMYSIGSISLIHSLIIASCGICIPIFYEKQYFGWFSVSIAILFLDTVFDYICYSYKKSDIKTESSQSLLSRI